MLRPELEPLPERMKDLPVDAADTPYPGSLLVPTENTRTIAGVGLRKRRWATARGTQIRRRGAGAVYVAAPGDYAMTNG